MNITTYHYWTGMLAVLANILIITHPADGESLYSKMKKGAVHYDQGSFDEALNSFVDAQIESPEDPQVKYNIASTHYQMKNYEDAVKSYQDVAATASDVRLEEQALYNIGNCLYRQGKLEESLEYYKKALELDPDDQDAKYNLEFVREEIKKRLNQAKQREQEQQKKEQQEEQDGQQQEQQKEGDTKEEDRQQQEPEQEPEQEPQQQAEEDRQNQQPQQKEEGQQEQAAAEEQQAASAREDQGQENETRARQMTREEAENWLRSVKEGKRDYSRQQKERAGRSYRPSKDW